MEEGSTGPPDHRPFVVISNSYTIFFSKTGKLKSPNRLILMGTAAKFEFRLIDAAGLPVSAPGFCLSLAPELGLGIPVYILNVVAGDDSLSVRRPHPDPAIAHLMIMNDWVVNWPVQMKNLRG